MTFAEIVDGTGDIAGWNSTGRPVEPEIEEEFTRLIEATRRLQDLVAGSRPDQATAAAAVSALDRASELLTGAQVEEQDQLAGRMTHIPGRDQTLVPALHYTHQDDDRVEGLVRFGRLYLGGNWAVHGGALPLVFDEILGRLGGAGGRPTSRTAFLHVNFRKITPLERDLQFRAQIDRIDGRKIFIAGSLHDGEDLLVDAEGLFLRLLPGQP